MSLVLAYVLFTVLRVVELLVLGAVIATWMGADPNNTIVRIVREPTEPLFVAVRPLARRIPGPLDWSPAIVLLGIEALRLMIAMALR